MSEPKVHSLVLDATPLITQHVSTLQTFATEFFTTPTVYNEIKDENARRNLALWGDKLQVRHPKPEFIKRVQDFAKLTGDFAVLSANDIHVIALAYELEVELNKGDWRLRKYPGEKKEFIKKKIDEKVDPQETKKEEVQTVESTAEATTTETETQPEITSTESSEKKKKNRRRGGKKVREKKLAAAMKEQEQEEGETKTETSTEEPSVSQEDIDAVTQKLEDLKTEPTEAVPENEEGLEEDYNEEEDDGEWITTDNLVEVMIRDSGEKIEQETHTSKIKVALVTGDFAVQNVTMQIGLNLMNTMSGLQIKRVRNYMLRCHACFTMLPIPKNGRPKHFCPRCGGNTLMRCAVSVDAKTGEVTPHLKANFEWHKRGDRFSIASPLSKNTQKRMGKKGFVHNKSNKQKEYEEPILREDQKEYQKALKDDDWLRRQNEKILNDYIGGGSADNFISPFVAQSFRNQGVKIGKGRFVNSNRRR